MKHTPSLHAYSVNITLFTLESSSWVKVREPGRTCYSPKFITICNRKTARPSLPLHLVASNCLQFLDVSISLRETKFHAQITQLTQEKNQNRKADQELLNGRLTGESSKRLEESHAQMKVSQNSKPLWEIYYDEKVEQNYEKRDSVQKATAFNPEKSAKAATLHINSGMSLHWY